MIEAMWSEVNGGGGGGDAHTDLVSNFTPLVVTGQTHLLFFNECTAVHVQVVYRFVIVEQNEW